MQIYIEFNKKCTNLLKFSEKYTKFHETGEFKI